MINVKQHLAVLVEPGAKLSVHAAEEVWDLAGALPERDEGRLLLVWLVAWVLRRALILTALCALCLLVALRALLLLLLFGMPNLVGDLRVHHTHLPVMSIISNSVNLYSSSVNAATCKGCEIDVQTADDCNQNMLILKSNTHTTASLPLNLFPPESPLVSGASPVAPCASLPLSCRPSARRA